MKSAICTAKGANMNIEIDHIKRSLADRRLDIVSDATGVSRSTLARIRDGRQENPTYFILRKLAAYFEANP
jgi:transcriptional regulator with XRE-family HTH domain